MARRKKAKQTLEMDPSSNILHYLHKILTFLTRDDKSQVFPSLTMEMEDILVRIAKGTEFLKQCTFDNNCKGIVDEISAVLEENKHAFTLSYGFENDELGKKVMVYKKISPVHVFKEPMVFKPLRRPNVIHASKSNESNPSLVMARFKTNTLNATLKFVKNDAQLILQYPDMTTEQADLVKKMITQCMAPQKSNESGFKNLYDPLTEALKIFSLKYHFELSAETHGDMKRLKFEKILKSTEVKKDLDSSISSISSEGSIPLSKKILKNVQYLTEAMAKLDREFIDSSIIRLKDFLKDSTREDLLFSDLNMHQKLFLTEWKTILKRVEIIKMFDVKGQMILDEIRDSVDRGANCGKFSVKVSSEMISSNVRSVTFTKTPLNVPSSRAAKTTAPAPLASVKTALTNVPTKSAPKPEDIPSSSSSSCNSEDETAVSVVYNKKIERFFQKTKTLPQTWIRATLTELKNFIQDESQASLIIPGITNPQMAYLTKWQKMLSNTDVIEAHQPDVQVILWAIHRAVFVNALKFKLSFKMTSVRKGQVRDITFIKTPCYPSLQTKAKQTKLNENVKETPATSKTTVLDTSSPPTAAPVLAKTPSVTSLTIPAGKSRAVNKEKRPKSANGTLRITVARKLPPAKVKLIEGLNQPVVSEKGIKMMRSMGWEGGALGLRGEGITEPIRLQLDMVSRAGLGSVKPPSRQPATPVKTNLPLNITKVVLPYMPDKKEFKKGILQTILKMLSEEQVATDVCFPNALSLKNWGFIKHHVTVLSNREKFSLEATPLNELCHSILDIMKKTDYLISACWGTSKTNVLIILSKIHYQPMDIDSNDWCAVANLDIAYIRAGKQLTNSGVSINDSGSVMMEGKPFRSYVLAQILDFCQQSKIVIDKGPSKGTIEKNVLLKGTMAHKQMGFVEDLILRLNRKSRSSSDSVHECSLFDEIKALIKGFILKVDFPIMKDADANIQPVHKIIRFHKIFDAQKTDQNLKDIPTSDKGTIGKIEIRSVESINDFPKNNKKDGTTKTLVNLQNHIEFVNKNAQNKTIDNDTKNLTDCQNTQEHYFDGNDTNNFLCCLPDYDDGETERENKMIEKTIVEYIFIENERFYPIAGIGRPIAVDDKQKDRPIVAENDKGNDMSLVTDSDKENDMLIFTDTDRENNMPIVTDSDKENDMLIFTDNHRENNMPIVTDSDKEKGIPRVTNSDKENDWPIVIENDKENNIPIGTKSYIECLSQKHADILNTSTESVDENVLCSKSINNNKQDSADDHTKREFLKEIEFVKKIESSLKAHRKERNEGNQECLDINEGSQTCKENQIMSKTDKDLGKRLRSNNQTPERLRKKCRYADFVKHISITPKDYPQSKITNKMAGEIQKSILNSIDYTQVLPLLKCHGIQDGALSYSCYSENSLNLIENVMKSNDFQVTVKQERNITRIKMTFRLNTYLDESVDTLLKRLKMYNMSLNTKEWVVIKKEQCSDYVVIQVEMDYNSFKFIRDERFTLYAGLDVAKFSIVWD